VPYPPLEVGVVDAEGRRDVGWFVSSSNGQAGPFDDPGVQDTTEAALIRQNVAFARRLGRLKLRATIDL
jgi:hypothetical protein